MNIRMKRFISLFLVALLAVGSFNLTAFAEKPAATKPKSVKIEDSKYVALKKQIKLKAVVSPSDASQKLLRYAKMAYGPSGVSL